MISFSVTRVTSLGHEVSEERPCKTSAEGGFILLLGIVGIVLSDGNEFEAMGLPSDAATTPPMSPDI